MVAADFVRVQSGPQVRQSGLRGEADAVRLDGDFLFFPKRSGCLFVRALAYAEFLVDLLRSAVVAKRPESATSGEFGKDLRLELVHLAAARRVQAEVDLAIGPDDGDVAFECLPGLELLEDIIGENQTAVGAIDDRLVPEISLAEGDEVDRLAWMKLVGCLVHVPGDARGGDQAPGLVIDHDVGDVMSADFHADFLFAERDHEILGETPVEKCPDARDGDAFESGKLA